MLNMVLSLSVLLWSFVMAAPAFSDLAGNDTDMLSLLEFKAKIADPLGTLSSWNQSLHFCQWRGVNCGPRHQRVTGLIIPSGRLGGLLSPHIGNLTFLRTLDLQNNSLSHRIPEEIGRLTWVQNLSLSHNQFSGAIPSNLSGCSSLQRLVLVRNKLSGEIPENMGSLPSLNHLDLGLNDLHGEMPSSIGNLSRTLEVFSAQWNHLRGRVPSSFGHLKRLKTLAFGGNNLSGTIPPSIYNISSIQLLSVQVNRLEGELPSHLGHSLLPRVRDFIFHTNQFVGSVPIVSNASNLVNFQVSINHLTGKVVSDFSGLPNLRILEVDENNLGLSEDDDLNFLSSLVNCTNLEILALNDNHFGGKLPEVMSNFSINLWFMSFGRNDIKGGVPAGVGNLVNLEAVGLEMNRLAGPIPSSIGRLQNLNEIALHSNKLYGSIPSSLGNLTSVTILTLAQNNLQGTLPSSLGKCKKLLQLDLSRNNLSGPIPEEVIGLSSLSQNLNLSQNHFTGTIPNQVGRLVNLGSLDISNNKLSGEIPGALGSCAVLEYLYLQGNSLQGTIPKAFDGLKGIKQMYLSHNNLSGRIPTYFEGFRNLERLNLSFNNFEGEIPSQGVFANTSVISVLGNSRLCGGVAQLHLRKCPSNAHSKSKHFPKFVVSVVCGLIAMLVLALVLGLLLRTRKGKNESTFRSRLGISFLEVSYGELFKATDGFCLANLIGNGSFGTVYKGNILSQDKLLPVAVKVLNLQASRAIKSFVAECKVLGSIKHRNIVKLLTACSSIDFQGNDFKALVYEFMVNGSLDEWLHCRHTPSLEQERHLNFVQRISIAADVANALDYLHKHSHESIVHSDLKPSNILLDSDMIARVGDFGLARFLSDPSRLLSLDQSSSFVRGSIGYIAPEYSMGSKPSREGDVYSYGILLLETFTGKRPTDEMFKDSFNLHHYVKMSLPDRLSQIMDSALPIEADQTVEKATSGAESYECTLENGKTISFWNCLQSVLKIGVSCSEEMPKERMSISEVIKELQLIKITYSSH